MKEEHSRGGTSMKITLEGMPLATIFSIFNMGSIAFENPSIFTIIVMMYATLMKEG